MTDHVFIEVPKSAQPSPQYACWHCGLFSDNPADNQPHDCEYYLNKCPGWCWGAGQSDDPFASMRTNAKAGAGCVASPAPTAPQATGSKGPSIRRQLTAEEVAGQYEEPPQPIEDRPGLTSETIDRDAYDDFMRNL